MFRLPTDLTAYDNRLCASIHFTSPTWVTLSDGTGRLYVIRTGDRGNNPEKWEVSCFCSFVRLVQNPEGVYKLDGEPLTDSAVCFVKHPFPVMILGDFLISFPPVHSFQMSCYLVFFPFVKSADHISLL